MNRSRAIYLAAALVLFGIEVLIALFVRDGIVRPYIGDVLAVALVYATLRALTPMRFTPALVVTLGIAFAVEIAQAASLLGTLGLGDNRIARIVLGGVFDWLDLAAYLAGVAVVAIAELSFRRRV